MRGREAAEAMFRTIALTFLVVLSGFGVASANHTTPCVAQNAGGLEQPAYVFAAGSTVTVWEETNGVPGLQREGCIAADGSAVPADTRVTGATVPSVPRCPIDLGGTPVCIV